ncbi:MAG: NAD(P)-dependent oxidoreductase [bacterium]|nr:NAD(P)-dependent oxidoreductase [bacterium]
MKVLITGATGFLGTHIARKFLERGCRVVGLDRDDFYFWPDLAREIELHKMDVRAVLSRAHLFRGVECLVHCAAALHDSPEEEIRSVNLGGTRAALDLCLTNGIPRFLFCSSTVVYGYFEFHPPVPEETPTAPEHPYAVSKVACERMLAEYRGKGLNASVFRPKSFIGAGRFGVFQLLCDWIAHGAPVPVIGSGGNRYQLMGVSDLAEGVYRMATMPVENVTLNLGAESFRTVREDLGDLIAHADTGSRLMCLPAAPTKLALTVIERLGLTQMWAWHYKTADRDCYVDTSKARALIGWNPAQSNLDALKETYDWYVANVKDFREKIGLGHHGVLWRERLLGTVRDVLACGYRRGR